jgi:hypothetical protein
MTASWAIRRASRGRECLLKVQTLRLHCDPAMAGYGAIAPFELAGITGSGAAWPIEGCGRVRRSAGFRNEATVRRAGKIGSSLRRHPNFSRLFPHGQPGFPRTGGSRSPPRVIGRPRDNAKRDELYFSRPLLVEDMLTAIGPGDVLFHAAQHMSRVGSTKSLLRPAE